MGDYLAAERLTYYRTGMLAGFLIGLICAGLLAAIAFGVRP